MKARSLARDHGNAVNFNNRNPNAYLKMIDGLLFGENPKEGLIKGRDFIHPGLGFRFSVPDGFVLHNAHRVVLAYGPADTMIFFDSARLRPGEGMQEYLRNRFARSLPLDGVREFSQNGMRVVVGQTINLGHEIQFAVVQYGADRIYRFLFVAKSGVAKDANREQTLRSFRKLKPREAANIKPFRIKIITFGRKDTILRVSRRMALRKNRIDHFLTLNGLQPGATLAPGRKVKIVVY